ncbi:MAG TPA: TolC family protein [Bryobacteraceae bacterium]|nr:TolC family protein [Bryobacteraceae bacterium]
MRVLLIAVAGLGLFGQTLTLEEAKAAALRNHPGIQAAEFGAEAAGERILQAESALRPVLSANITGAGAADASRVAAGALNNPIIYSRLALGATVTQTVTDFGRTRELVASSKISSQAERERVKATKADILLQVERAYFQALRSHAVTEIAKSTIESRQLLVDQVEALVNAKLKSGLDLSFASTNLAEGKLLLASAQNEEQAAMAMLAEAMGSREPVTQALTDVPMPETIGADRNKLTEEALRMRPELAAGRLDTEAAQRLANAEHALRYPTISAVATAGVIPARVDNLSSNYVAGGVNVSLPFLNGGLFKSRQREAALRAAQAEKRVRQMENAVSRDVAVALLDVTTAEERLGLTTQLIAQAAQAVELAQSRYDLGLSSIVELSQAQLVKTNAEIQSATARYDYQLRRAVLDFRTGTIQ